jgi:hypothetical protein
MAPILGILASGISGNLWQPGKDFDSIATVTVGGGGAASITFSSIPATYRHLEIRYIAQNSGFRDLWGRFNGDTTTTYNAHGVYGDGASAAAFSGTNPQANMSFGYTSLSAQTNIFGAGVVSILDYANTSKYKTIRSLAGYDANGSGLSVLYSGLWQNTAAITSITMLPTTSGTPLFSQYSSFALYGVK